MFSIGGDVFVLNSLRQAQISSMGFSSKVDNVTSLAYWKRWRSLTDHALIKDSHMILSLFSVNHIKKETCDWCYLFWTIWASATWIWINFSYALATSSNGFFIISDMTSTFREDSGTVSIAFKKTCNSCWVHMIMMMIWGWRRWKKLRERERERDQEWGRDERAWEGFFEWMIRIFIGK